MKIDRDFIPVNIFELPDLSKKFVNECLDSNWVSSGGEFVSKFENEIAKITNKKYGSAVSNGSDALDIAITALNLNQGDQIILPNFTIISCLNQILRLGVEPLFVDADPDTAQIDRHSQR